MPPLIGTDASSWLNTAEIPHRAALRGHVVLVDFWDYTCVNCLRTLPYLRAWHQRYADHGLRIIGIHTPEFKFAGHDKQVAQAIEQFKLPYPVLLDNQYANWNQFANRAWPTKYLIDANGYIRYQRQGEGAYATTEQAIQQLLKARQPGLKLPKPMRPLREEDSAGAACYRTTPELHAGYQGGGLFGGALGNPEGYVTNGVMLYDLPERKLRQEGQFYLGGFWQAHPEAVSLAGDDLGRVVVPYAAVGVNAVLSPSADTVELMLDLPPSQKQPLVEVRLDGQPLPRHLAGADVAYNDHGRALVHVSRPRMYHLVEDSDYAHRELTLVFHARGLALFALTFNTCVAPSHNENVFFRA